MNRKIIAGLAFALLVTNVSLTNAAPVKNIDQGQTVAGYNYYDLDGSAHGIYLEHGLTDRVIVGTEYIDLKHSQHIFDVYGKYKLDPNFLVNLGIRDYKHSSSKLTVGLEATTPLSDVIDGYAGVKYNSNETEFKIGIGHMLNENWGLDLNYSWHDFDHGKNVNGLGVGVNYSF
ncbi:MAG TPA: hypothetical protein IAB06_01275 [Candidatus Avacidaminococcus intestinavium]|uniref:Outer membrane protein beta-barrel domain-containing protein n=1 Tax=Candidatus Avacidaminococcus intestinavium TaxID=2840684 RepID=A0A9D1MN89_9FIRM|nr:hypothetical protein [Candidatus Avacidaminococcus intestinavium]